MYASISCTLFHSSFEFKKKKKKKKKQVSYLAHFGLEDKSNEMGQGNN